MWSNMSLPCLPPLQVLDAFMTEVGQRFSTRTEERLLAVVYTLQQRTYKTGLPASAAVPEVFKKELAGGGQAEGSDGQQIDVRCLPACPCSTSLRQRQLCLTPCAWPVRHAGVCKACGSRDAVSAGKLAHLQQQFAKDLDPGSPAAPQTLGEMTDRLKVGRSSGWHGWNKQAIVACLVCRWWLTALYLWHSKPGLAHAAGERD